MSASKIKVLMVCLGNICRSPTAEVAFRKVVEEQGLKDYFEIDSAGTGDWHIGHAPDSRATLAAEKRKMDLSPLRARLVNVSDFERFDYIFAMDKDNFKNLCVMSPNDKQDKVSLFLCHTDSSPTQGYEEVPDPYYSGEDGFELVLDLVEEGSSKIVTALKTKHKLGRS